MKKLTVLFFALILMISLLVFPISTTKASKAKKTNVSSKHSSKFIHVKFDSSKDIELGNDTFVSSDNSDLSSINSLLNTQKTTKKKKLISRSSENIKKDRDSLAKKHGNKVPNLNNYYRIELKPGVDYKNLINQISTLDYVSEVYAEPLPAPAPASPDYTSLQSHLKASPTGMGVSGTENYLGAKGSNVKIVDLEYSWNTSHEDISDARQADTMIASGTYVDPWNNTDHGTAVAGILSGDRNTIGINGIASDAKLHTVNTYSSNYGWDIASSVYTAASIMTAGDVMLIEQQTYGPEGRGYLPVEWIPAVYDSIKFATLKGIIVIEPAANGGENLNDAVFGTSFPMGKEDSGAIIVGAGSACDGSGNHSRMYFSNYGTRVNVQGFGECVVTAGYGSLQNNGNANSLYTNNFNGTSSASALVAGIAASVSSSYEAQKGVNISPSNLRNLLKQTGTPQNTTTNPGNVGPLPNLKAALDTFSVPKDTTAPTTPSKLTVGLNKYTATLNWKPSTDNAGSVKYRVYRNGKLITTTSNLSYININLSRWTSYTYKIQAVDAAGNVSGYSNSVTVKTK